ncbi:hypothetical protein GCM10011354_00240 [Egicoccus halophilus]|uniref:Uncharacterized protein n=2 Tax=Egicoccus halophilus TaxID=1670830 RepID=A0A8J3A4K8_9ACTN|nr:hypothetical protein GCM10011354_00240 [Egicoccus halophilus]
MAVTLRQLLATPYVMHVRPVQDEQGTWLRRAEYPELEDCYAIDASPWTAMDALDEHLMGYLVDRLAAGGDVRVPRPARRGVDVERHVDEAGFGPLRKFLDVEVDRLRGDEEFAARVRELRSRQASVDTQEGMKV